MSFYLNHYQRLRPVLFDMMQRGVNWDVEEANKRAGSLEARRSAILAEIQQSSLGDLCSVERHRSRLYANLLDEQRAEKAKDKDSRDREKLKALAAESRQIRAAGLQTEVIVKGLSDEKIKNYFYGREKLPVIKQRRKGKGGSTPTVNDAALLKIKLLYPRYEQLVGWILEYRKCQKLVSTYLDPAKVSDDGRIRFLYKPFGTQSGRLSASASALNEGFNIQNPDSGLKYLIIPDPDIQHVVG